jgi:hypothetical protein
VFIAIAAAFDGLAGALFPPPQATDPSDLDAVREQMANIPLGAHVVVVVGSTLAAIAASYVTGILVGSASFWPFATGAIALALTLANALRSTRPSWFLIAAPAGVIAAAALGWWLSGRNAKPIKKVAPATPPRQSAKR